MRTVVEVAAAITIGALIGSACLAFSLSLAVHYLIGA